MVTRGQLPGRSKSETKVGGLTLTVTVTLALAQTLALTVTLALTLARCAVGRRLRATRMATSRRRWTATGYRPTGIGRPSTPPYS